MSDAMKAIAVVLVVGIGLFSLLYRLAFPALTETQVFVALFPYIAPTLAVGFILMAAAAAMEDE